eukprot:scaffold244241_cov40-Prasinocladus_malaysianus.AAC.2
MWSGLWWTCPQVAIRRRMNNGGIRDSAVTESNYAMHLRGPETMQQEKIKRSVCRKDAGKNGGPLRPKIRDTKEII